MSLSNSGDSEVSFSVSLARKRVSFTFANVLVQELVCYYYNDNHHTDDDKS